MRCATWSAARIGLPESETVEYEVVGDKPWSGFNYYLGDYRSKVAINSDLPQFMANLPRLIAHESYPGHHTEHCRKEAGLVGSGQLEQTLFLVNTPQCLMAEGLADLALGSDRRSGVGPVGAGHLRRPRPVFRRGKGATALRRVGATAGCSSGCRADVARRGAQPRRRGGCSSSGGRCRRRNALANRCKFLSSPLWRAYTSTYVEGYRLLGGWLDEVPVGAERTERFRRLLDEPLVPSSLRAA